MGDTAGKYTVDVTVEVPIGGRRGDDAIVAGGMDADDLAISEADAVLEDWTDGTETGWDVGRPEVTGHYDGGTLVTVAMVGYLEAGSEDEATQAALDEIEGIGEIQEMATRPFMP